MIKMTLFFNLNRYGWSETWYNATYELTTLLNAVQQENVPHRLANKHIGGTTLVAIRFADILTGATRLVRPEYKVPSSVQINAADAVHTAIQVPIRWESGVQTTRLFRAIGDPRIVPSPHDPTLATINDAGKAPINSYLEFMKEWKFGELRTTRHKLKGQHDGIVKGLRPSADDPSITVVEVAPGSTVPMANQMVVFRGGGPGLYPRLKTGPFKVLWIMDNSFAIPYRLMETFNPVRPLRYVIVQLKVDEIIWWTFAEVTKRQTGRAFFLQRGRSTKRIRRI